MKGGAPWWTEGGAKGGKDQPGENQESTGLKEEKTRIGTKKKTKGNWGLGGMCGEKKAKKKGLGEKNRH